jgi:hypothetical protein
MILDPELKKKWVEALRSGKYRQGYGYLRYVTDEFCCLGVLCDIYDKTLWIRNAWNYFYKYQVGTIPGEIADKIGITIDEQSALITKNDRPEDFSGIADFIERYM